MTHRELYSIVQAAAMKLSTDDIIILLDLYKNHESLYNTLHPKHNDKSVRRFELKQLVHELKAKDIHIPDIPTLKKKIKSLKDTYRTVRVKVDMSKKHATEDEEVYKPTMKWYPLADSFLRPFVTSQLVPDSNLLDVAGIETMMLMKGSPDDSNDPNISDQNPFDEEMSESKYTSYRKRPSTLKRVLPHENDDEYCCTSNKMEVKMETRSKPDACEAFGTYVAAQMRSLPRTRQLMLQGEIQNAITKQFLEWENENDDIESTVVYVP